MSGAVESSVAGRERWKTLAAFAVIYLVWGSTFLAIRVGVHQAPPLVFAALRFFTAGVLMWGWGAVCAVRGGGWRAAWPQGREWRSLLVLATLIFLCDYGLLFWAEGRVASGLAAVMLATIPVFIAVLEIALLGTQRMSAGLAAGLGIGLAGVAVLVSHGLRLGGAPVETKGALALIGAALSWAVATVLTKRMPLPGSKAVSAGVQMTVGGMMLAAAALVTGGWRMWHPAAMTAAAWWALAWLIVMGSIVGFGAYVWLIHHESPTRVGTYAYVNPVVAVGLGYFLGGEGLQVRTAVGSALVLVSVVAIQRLKRTAAG